MRRNPRKITRVLLFPFFFFIFFFFFFFFFSFTAVGRHVFRVICLLFFGDLRSDVQLCSLIEDASPPFDATTTKKGDFNRSLSRLDIDEIADDDPIRKFIPQNPKIILHNPDLCRGQSDLAWFLYVHSAPGNFERRKMLRGTYANTTLFKKIRFKVAFFLGLPQEGVIEEQIKNEFHRYGDIVQGNFMDSFKNLTIKAVMAINWICDHCPQAPFAIKVDDDTFLNVFAILPFLEENYGNPFISVCPVFNNTWILRSPLNCLKWCVSEDEFPGVYYPVYCGGIYYALSMDLVKEMRGAILSTPLFWIEDVYVTGLLAHKVAGKVEYIDISKHYTMSAEYGVSQYANASQPITMYVIHVTDEKMFYPLWNSLLKRLTKEQIDMIE